MDRDITKWCNKYLVGARKYVLYRLYSINKYKDKMVNISDFEQGEIESLHDVWERCKLMTKRYPSYYLDDLVHLQYFTQGLKWYTRFSFDVSIKGVMRIKFDSEVK